MLNLDTGSAVTLIAENSTIRYLLRSYIGDRPLDMTSPSGKAGGSRQETGCALF
jgi:hypothetical protein